jgi:hypothetical protein
LPPLAFTGCNNYIVVVTILYIPIVEGSCIPITTRLPLLVSLESPLLVFSTVSPGQTGVSPAGVAFRFRGSFFLGFTYMEYEGSWVVSGRQNHLAIALLLFAASCWWQTEAQLCK